MKFLGLVLLVWTTIFTSVLCKNYMFGVKSNDVKLAYRTKVKYEALPLQKRVKYFSYNASYPIKAINCFDYQNSEASINVTEGGIGSPHVTLRMKSQRSYRLEYAIDIYV